MAVLTDPGYGASCRSYQAYVMDCVDAYLTGGYRPVRNQCDHTVYFVFVMLRLDIEEAKEVGGCPQTRSHPPSP